MTHRHKLFLTLRRRDGGEDAAAFARRVLDRAAAVDRAAVVDLVDQPPVAAAGLPTPGAPPLDALVELWSEPGRADGIVAEWSGDPDLGLHAAYVVDEVVQRDRERTWPEGEPTPGIKVVYLVERTPDLTVEQFVDHWRTVHGPLALRHHVGCTRYVQNAVTARLAAAVGDPVVGLAELHFPSAHDLVEHMYDSPEGMRAIGADVATFVGAAAGYLTTEHVVT